MRAFADHFSRLATGYAVYRPQYPEGLFAALAAASSTRGTVWDCATGSGQAVPGLAAHFRSVLASDASAEQVRAAAPHPRVHYFVARAEAVPLRSRSVGLVTVAQALHWLELPEFYAEARRVLQPGGLLVAWTYGRQRVDDGLLDEVLNDFYDHVVGSYWAPERRWVETGYRTLRFPFDEMRHARRAPRLHRYLVSGGPVPRDDRTRPAGGAGRTAGPIVGRPIRAAQSGVAAQRAGGTMRRVGCS